MPRISSKDPSGVLPYEMRAAREAERLVQDAIHQAQRFVIENNITDPLLIDEIIDNTMQVVNVQLSRMGLEWVQSTENQAIIKTNDRISRMGHTSILLGPMGLPKNITRSLDAIVLADVQSLTMDVRKNVSRAIINGVNRGLGARELGKLVQEATDGDIARARTIARTTVMKTFNQTAVEDYKRAGATGYALYPTEDERLCIECRKAAYENENSGELRVYSEQEIIGLVPVHPNCRCTVIGRWDGDEKVYLSAPALNTIFFAEVTDATG